MKPLFLKEGEIHQAGSSDQIDSVFIKGSTLTLFDSTLSYEKGDVVINAEYPWFTVTPVSDAGFTEGTGVAGTFYYYNPSSFLLVELTNDGSTTPHTIPPGWVVGAPLGHDPAKSFTGWGLWVAQSTMAPQIFNTSNWLGPLRFDIFAGDLTSGSFTNGSVTTSALADNAVTLSKMQDIADGSLLGNNTGSSGDPAVLTAAEVRALLNIEDGANNYALPAATDSVIGGVKPGAGISVAGDGTLNVDASDLPIGSANQKGIVQVDGITLSANNGVIAVVPSAIYSHPNHSGHVVSAGDGATTIQPGVITSSMIVAGTITDNELSETVISTLESAGPWQATDTSILTTSGAGYIVPGGDPAVVTSFEVDVHDFLPDAVEVCIQIVCDEAIIQYYNPFTNAMQTALSAGNDVFGATRFCVQLAPGSSGSYYGNNIGSPYDWSAVIPDKLEPGVIKFTAQNTDANGGAIWQMRVKYWR